tara:strand:- start:34 stop:231 length:198 start_codon:yes stop_codon:yes gene_type:complete
MEKANNTSAPTYTMESEAGLGESSVAGFDNGHRAEGPLQNISDDLFELCGEIWRTTKHLQNREAR